MIDESRIEMGDCLDILKFWKGDGLKEFIDLIYIDPPFNSKRNYNIIFDSKSGLSEQAFGDIWSQVPYLQELDSILILNKPLHELLSTWIKHKDMVNSGAVSYLIHMSLRCMLMRDMLKPTGSFYYHCDPTMSHYVKVILDYIFGVGNFRNEITWCYNKWTNTATYYQRNHDTILFYSKGVGYKFNKQYKITEYQLLAQEKGYTSNNINGKRQIIIFDRNKVSQETIDRFDIVTDKPNIRGTALSDHWNDINLLASTAKERLGYPTQKPEALLERIILASSNEGDLVADFFMGGGTTIAVASKLKRKFIGTDINRRAVEITRKRLEDMGLEPKKDFLIRGIPRSAMELRELIKDNTYGRSKNSKFELQSITTGYYLKNVIESTKKSGDGSIDGMFKFKYDNKQFIGIVQVTSSANMNHFKAFCSEVGKGTGEIGVYVTFADTITAGMTKEAKSYGKIGGADKVQILTFEDLIDNGKQYVLPFDLLK